MSSTLICWKKEKKVKKLDSKGEKRQGTYKKRELEPFCFHTHNTHLRGGEDSDSAISLSHGGARHLLSIFKAKKGVLPTRHWGGRNVRILSLSVILTKHYHLYASYATATATTSTSRVFSHLRRPSSAYCTETKREQEKAATPFLGRWLLAAGKDDFQQRIGRLLLMSGRLCSKGSKDTNQNSCHDEPRVRP